MTGTTALVWFKRDLRVRDHAPLAAAMRFERAMGLVVIEPQWLQSPECDPRHVGFLLDCVAALQRGDKAEATRLLSEASAREPSRELPRRLMAQAQDTRPAVQAATAN